MSNKPSYCEICKRLFKISVSYLENDSIASSIVKDLDIPVNSELYNKVFKLISGEAQFKEVLEGLEDEGYITNPDKLED